MLLSQLTFIDLFDKPYIRLFPKFWIMPRPTKKGMVAFLDTLGTRDLSLQGATDYVDRQAIFITKLKTILPQHESFKEMKQKDPDISDPMIVWFADTIIITWEIKGFPDFPKEFNLVFGEWLGTGLVLALANKLPIRGAIGYGAYFYEGEHTVLGPAVGDVASWHDEADWIGIIASPNYGAKLTLVEEQLKIERGEDFPLRNHYVRYDVPLKKGDKQQLWAVSWPLYYYYQLKKIIPDATDTGMAPFMQHICCFSMPKGTESKFNNAIDFFGWYRKHHNLR